MPVVSFTYSIPYLVFTGYLIILMFLEFRDKKYNKDTQYTRWAAIIGFIFFFGLRGFPYTDWQVYYKLFEKLPTIWQEGSFSVMMEDLSDSFYTDVNRGNSGIEMGFIFFTVLLKSIIPDYFVWIFVNTIIDVILLDLFLRRYSSYYVFSLILFMAFGGCLIEMNLMRNVKAILLFLISIKYMEQHRIVPYMLLNILGSFFHTSSLIFLPLYFFLNKVWPKWLLWSIFGVGMIIIIMQIGFLKPLLQITADLVEGRLGVLIKLYLASDLYSQSYNLGLSFFERSITFILLVLFQNKLIERHPRNVIFINAFVLYFIIFFYFTEVMVAVERLTLLFVFSYWILYPELLAIINKVFQKWIFITGLVLYSCLKIVSMNSNIFSKYDNLLFGIDNFEARQQIIDNELDTFIDPN